MAETRIYGQSGGRELIATLTNTSAGEFDFTSIPSGYNRLTVEGAVRSDVAAFVDAVHCYINEDTTDANYHYQISGAFNAAANSTEGAAPYIAACAGSTAPAGSVSALSLFIESPNSSNIKEVASQVGATRATDNLATGIWLVSSAITDRVSRLRIRTDDHPTAGLTGTVRLYGER